MKEKMVIEPDRNLWSLDIKELWRYRDLIMLYVRRHIVTLYKQTILGPLWLIIQPLLTIVMYMVLFGGIAGISTDGVPQALFYLSGLICWTYFADCLTNSGTTFISYHNVFGKVYFPRLVIPVSIVISNLVKFAVQLFLFFIFYLFFIVKGVDIHLTVYAWLVPILILMLAGMGLGVGLIVTSLTTKYRDLTFLVQFGVQLWMYASPVVYPLSALKTGKASEFLWLIQLNPITSILETFKLGFLGTGSFSIFGLLYSMVFTIIVLFFGAVIFNKVQRSFMDVI